MLLPWDLASPAGSPACHPPTDHPPATNLLSSTKVHVGCFLSWLLSFKLMLPGYPALPIHRVSPAYPQGQPCGLWPPAHWSPAPVRSLAAFPELTEPVWAALPCCGPCLGPEISTNNPTNKEDSASPAPHGPGCRPQHADEMQLLGRLITTGDSQPCTATQPGVTAQIKT